MMDQTRANSIVGRRLWRSSSRLFVFLEFVLCRRRCGIETVLRCPLWKLVVSLAVWITCERQWHNWFAVPTHGAPLCRAIGTEPMAHINLTYMDFQYHIFDTVSCLHFVFPSEFLVNWLNCKFYCHLLVLMVLISDYSCYRERVQRTSDGGWCGTINHQGGITNSCPGGSDCKTSPFRAYYKLQ